MDRREQVLRTLKAHQMTVSTAESCTGGMIAAALTDLGGSSAVFVGGVVSYWTELKHKILGVSQETLDTYGAVSPQTAREMAEGVRALTGSDLALSVTGVAGPDRDERDNPVGLVYLALTDGETTTVCQPTDLGSIREEIRRNAVEAALEMLLDYFEKK
ncbi:MAG: CinA family protein [Clostridiales bacterium]|nr:CinA family protein [Clostridiales bacterium]